jgi:peptidoglycan/LPS O-acetylase OafA/YrhL
MENRIHRNRGLDIVRSFAILLVLFCHGLAILYLPIHNSSSGNGIFFATGYIGVEIFFVLSGFLIGRIIINQVIHENTWVALKTFYIRRWLRTLPLYFFVVILLVILGSHFYWQNLFFIQNFNGQNLSFFPVSWSLSIEEWFYLLVPLFFILGFKIWKLDKRILFFIICITFILLELFWRIYIVKRYDSSFDFGIRKQIYLRLDSIMIGVLLAGLKIYFEKIYQFIFSSKFSSYILVLSISGFLFSCYYMYHLAYENTMDQAFFGRTFLFSWTSLFSAMLIGWCESSKVINMNFTRSKIFRIFNFISVTSYAAYLIHFDIYLRFKKLVSTNGDNVIMIWLLTLVVVYILSFLLYNYLELPFMKLRNRVTNKNKAQNNVLHVE